MPFQLIHYIQLVQLFFRTFTGLKFQWMNIIDTKGQSCPIPIIETRKALKTSKSGETFEVISDDYTAFTNISRFLKDNEVEFSVSETDGIWTFKITNNRTLSDIKPAEAYCETKDKKNSTADFVVVISSELMGKGDDELGRKLMKSFFIALSCHDTMPSSIVFYNSGVKLTGKNSGIAELLHEIERKGAELLICGTCVDHFRIAAEINVGKICDMYVITQKLSEAGNIISP